ncbi:RAG1-ACTIVATING PROTEIN 1 [Salix viminalis]|uniref:Bidirectional sugar transporter SWEET n=2 Tax=Salix viminalis TaxID=40686 RepID=A0A9Q0NVG9_SALVM|nr:RAG1-ACTIVATING PROTEIN 1 [Salix viminalis]
MTDTATTRTIIGLIGNVISFLLFLSPVPTFVKIIKEKAVKDFKSDPYVATLLNCAMWIFYGLPLITHNNTLVVTINGIGFVIECIYVAIFFVFSPGKKKTRIIVELVIEVIFMAIVILITVFAFHTSKTRAMFVGILCIIFNICMYSSPLTVMRMVIKTKSVKYMPFYLSLANFTNGLVWLIYGLLDFDINLVLPNGLGALSGLIQLILYGIYYRSTKWDDDNDVRGDRSEVELPSSA